MIKISFVDKILGINKEEKLQINSEERQRDFNREQQYVDVATRNEEVDYRMQESRSDLLKWQQDLTSDMELFKHRIRSEVYTKDGQWKQKTIAVRNDKGKVEYQFLPPLANELFIDYIETQIEPFLSRNLFSCNLSTKQILEMLKNTCDDVADAIADGWDIYEIEFINYDLILRLVKNMIIPGPFRALNDGQRRHDRTIAKMIEAYGSKGEFGGKKKKILGVVAE